MNKEPIMHHYIPQFILRNFCFDDKGQLFYYDKKTSKTSVMNTKEIFMGKNLYRDEKNSSSNPTKIERDLAVFECEVSQIIKDKFLALNEIMLSYEEHEKLKLFFALMGLRSKNASEQFGLNASSDSKKFYSTYQKDGDLSDFWKRNLGYIVNCRSLTEVLSHNSIDKPIKIFMMRDIFGFIGQYFIIAERKGKEQFSISDAYPTVIYGNSIGIRLHLYSIFPISPDRIILLASNGVKSAPRNIAFFSNGFLKAPQVNYNKNIITIFVKRLYDEGVKYINSNIFEGACEGWAFKNP